MAARRWMALFLAFLMVLLAMPTGVLADAVQETEHTPGEGDEVKKALQLYVEWQEDIDGYEGEYPAHPDIEINLVRDDGVTRKITLDQDLKEYKIEAEAADASGRPYAYTLEMHSEEQVQAYGQAYELVSLKSEASDVWRLSSRARAYTVTFYDHLDEEVEVWRAPYGAELDTDRASVLDMTRQPEKTEEGLFQYTFAGWSPALDERIAVTESREYRPIYEAQAVELMLLDAAATVDIQVDIDRSALPTLYNDSPPAIELRLYKASNDRLVKTAYVAGSSYDYYSRNKEAAKSYTFEDLPGVAEDYYVKGGLYGPDVGSVEVIDVKTKQESADRYVVSCVYLNPKGDFTFDLCFEEEPANGTEVDVYIGYYQIVDGKEEYVGEIIQMTKVEHASAGNARLWTYTIEDMQGYSVTGQPRVISLSVMSEVAGYDNSDAYVNSRFGKRPEIYLPLMTSTTCKVVFMRESYSNYLTGESEGRTIFREYEVPYGDSLPDDKWKNIPMPDQVYCTPDSIVTATFTGTWSGIGGDSNNLDSITTDMTLVPVYDEECHQERTGAIQAVWLDEGGVPLNDATGLGFDAQLYYRSSASNGGGWTVAKTPGYPSSNQSPIQVTGTTKTKIQSLRFSDYGQMALNQYWLKVVPDTIPDGFRVKGISRVVSGDYDENFDITVTLTKEGVVSSGKIGPVGTVEWLIDQELIDRYRNVKCEVTLWRQGDVDAVETKWIELGQNAVIFDSVDEKDASGNAYEYYITAKSPQQSPLHFIFDQDASDPMKLSVKIIDFAGSFTIRIDAQRLFSAYPSLHPDLLPLPKLTFRLRQKEYTNDEKTLLNTVENYRVFDGTFTDPEDVIKTPELRIYAPNGNLYHYECDVDPVPGYTLGTFLTSYNNPNGATTFMMTGSFNPGLIDKRVRVQWYAPKDITAHPAVQIGLIADGVRANVPGTSTPYILPANRGNSWSGVFEDIDELKRDTSAIDYTFDQLADLKDYEVGRTPVYDSETDMWVFTNIYLMPISGTKAWVGAPQGTKLPDVKLNLYVNDPEGRGIPYDTVILKGGQTSYAFNKRVPSHKADGTPNTVTVKEEPVPGYTVSYGDNYEISNTYTPGMTAVRGTKTWEGVSQGAEVPAITIRLMRNGAEIDSRTLTSGQTNYAFTGLAKYAPDGTEYVYTVTEDTVPGYTTRQSGNDFTNTYAPGAVNIRGTKTWAGVPEGAKVPEITIRLLRDGTEIDSRTLASGRTDYAFTGLAKYAPNGTEYAYTVTEDPVPGYATRQHGNDFTNTYAPGAVSVDGTKTWAGVPEGAQVPQITIRLMQNGVEIDSTTLTNGRTNYAFTGLAKYAPDGTEYAYTVVEDPVPGYTTRQHGNDFTNTYAPGSVSVRGAKTWAGVSEGAEVPAITIRLMRNGVEIDSVTLRNGQTKYAFTGLLKYAPDGTRYAYKVTEDPVPGYTTQQRGNDFTNTYAPGTVNVRGTKTWVGVPEGAQTPGITIRLYRNGAEVDSLRLNSGATRYAFGNLPRYAPDGTAYQYTVSEDQLPGYTGSQSGRNFTNTYAPGTRDIVGTKTWVGVPSGEAVPDITINLLRNGASRPYRSVTLTGGATQYSFRNLPRYAPDGSTYRYTVREAAVEGYAVSYSGYDITNTRTEEVTSVSVRKVWDAPGVENLPQVTVRLFRDGKAYAGAGRLVLSAPNFSGTFDNLPKYAPDGREYRYTVKENAVGGFALVGISGSAEGGFVITNRARMLNVYFIDWDGAILRHETVPYMGSATPPADPSRDGYEFTGWLGDYTNVTEDRFIYAQYRNRGGRRPSSPLDEIVDMAIPLASGSMSNLGDCIE